MGNVLLPIILITLPHVILRVRDCLKLESLVMIVEDGSWQPITASSSFLVSFCPGLMEEPGAEIGTSMSGRVWQEVTVEGRVYSLGRCACIYAQLLSHVWLWDSMDYILPDSSVHGISQARILEWAAIPSSRESSQNRDRTCVSCISCIDRWILYHWATWEAPSSGRWLC